MARPQPAGQGVGQQGVGQELQGKQRQQKAQGLVLLGGMAGGVQVGQGGQRVGAAA